MWGGCRRRLLALAVTLGAAAMMAGGAFVPHPAAAHAPATVVVKVDPAGGRVRIPPGFLGISTEYWAMRAYAGNNPSEVDPVLVQLIRNLMPGQTGSLRIGGVSTDKSWWPVAGLAKPPGVIYTLDRRRLEVIKALADEVGARLILGVNFEADSSRVAGTEARAMLSVIGRGRIAAFELGNEPELWGDPAFGWYQIDGHNVTGRPLGYDMASYIPNFAGVAAGMPPAPLAGPASGAVTWLADLGPFIASEPRLAMITAHRYPYEACNLTPSSPVYPTIARLLSPAASDGQADGVVPFVRVAHAAGLPFRIDEMNTISCGNPPGLAHTFAMALWAIDALFADARVGVDGVNIHTWAGAVYQLFSFKHLQPSGWEALVDPEYYGLLMFAQAAPAGSRLLKTSGGTEAVRAWATRAADGTIRVTLLNDDTAMAHRVAVQIRGAHSPASVERLLAPSAAATHGVTLGGQTLAKTTTGEPAGPLQLTTINSRKGRYSLLLPAASAALLTLR